MLPNNYSQLPVMEGDKKVNGAISWKSIGSNKVTNMEVTEVSISLENARLQKAVQDFSWCPELECQMG